MTLIIFLHALFGTSFPISKHLLGICSPIFLAGTRMVIAGLFLLAYQYFWPTAIFKFKKKHWYIFAQIIIFGIFITYILRFSALKYLPAGKTAFFYNFSPFLSSLYAYLLFGEKMRKQQWLGLLIGFIGMIPIIISISPQEASFNEMLYISLPELAIIISVVLHSYSWIMIQRLVRDKDYSPMMVNGICMTIGGFLALITSLCVEQSFPTDVAEFTLWLGIIILTCNILAHNIYGYLLKHYSATFLSFSGFLGPLFATFYGWAFLKEQVTWHFYISATVVFCGLYLFYKGELDNKSIKNDKGSFDKPHEH